MGEAFASARSHCFGVQLQLEIKGTPLTFLMITNYFINLASFLFYDNVSHLLMSAIFYFLFLSILVRMFSLEAMLTKGSMYYWC